MKIKILTLLTICIFFGPYSALALNNSELLDINEETNSLTDGGVSDGGGDVIICKEGIWPYIKKKVFLADTYDFMTSAKASSLPSRPTEKEKIEAIRKRLNMMHDKLGDIILKRLKKLKFIYVKNVKEMDGDNVSVPDGCTKKQLAIQNVVTGEVRVNKELHNSISPWEKALFKIHESFISLRNPGRDTTLVRSEVREIINTTSINDILADMTCYDLFDRVYNDVIIGVRSLIEAEISHLDYYSLSLHLTKDLYLSLSAGKGLMNRLMSDHLTKRPEYDVCDTTNMLDNFYLHESTLTDLVLRIRTHLFNCAREYLGCTMHQCKQDKQI